MEKGHGDLLIGRELVNVLDKKLVFEKVLFLDFLDEFFHAFKRELFTKFLELVLILDRRMISKFV